MTEPRASARIEAELQALLDKYDRRPDSTHVEFVVTRPSSAWTWTYGDVEQRYFIASITKRFANGASHISF